MNELGNQVMSEWLNAFTVIIPPFQLFSVTVKHLKIQSGVVVQTLPLTRLKSTPVFRAGYPFVSGVWCYLGQQMERRVMNSGSKQISAETRPTCCYLISNQVHYEFFLIQLWCVKKSQLKILCILLTYVCLQALLFVFRNLQCVLFINGLALPSNYSR